MMEKLRWAIVIAIPVGMVIAIFGITAWGIWGGVE